MGGGGGEEVQKKKREKKAPYHELIVTKLFNYQSLDK